MCLCNDRSTLSFISYCCTAFKASGRVPAKSGLCRSGEFRDVNSTAVVRYTSRANRHVWSGLTARAGCFKNTQAAFLRSELTSLFITPNFVLLLEFKKAQK